jgi:hypothetical protein
MCLGGEGMWLVVATSGGKRVPLVGELSKFILGYETINRLRKHYYESYPRKKKAF